MNQSTTISSFMQDTALVFRAPSPSYTPRGVTANLVARVSLSLVANVICLVPLRLLHRNGEFAAAVFVATVELLNLETIVLSLTWRNDDVDSFWPGYGLCDVDGFFHNAATSLYATCLLAIVRNLAQQVGMMRASPLSCREKKWRNIKQALVMFPLPIVQLAMTWPVTSQRFQVGTLVGCSWIPHPSWPNLVFFVLPLVVVGVVTAGYAVLTYYRYRQISKSTQPAISSDRSALRRSQRTKRRLYLMVISILVPYLPVVIAFGVINILNKHGLLPYDYYQMHRRILPTPWNTIALYPSSDVPWLDTNVCYINILSSVSIFLFFGTTKDAMNQYRCVFLALGLARLFPRLNEVYDPDSSSRTASSFASSYTTVMGKCKTSKYGSYSSSGRWPSIHTLSTTEPRDQHFVMPATDLERGPGPDAAHRRNPFPWRTTLSLTVPFSLAWLLSRRPSNKSSTPLQASGSKAPLSRQDVPASTPP
ncbi:hypothetical protein CDD81_180 [Ophiocordyceps australis]|uniref:Pheromone a factor receptor n=1 Tax=Ophiocordyceps australis TaxID=1399860 RepID=A0A2C5YBN0_9HYPO|nr:hypothetical protein CDD81_180 [Ophiocordyceps australis]